MTIDPTTLLVIWIVSAFVGCEFVFHARRICERVGFVHTPRSERWSARKVPMGGGAAIILAAMFVAVCFLRGHGWHLAAPLTAVCFIGLWDDKYTMRPRIKLAIQVLSAAFLAWRGYRFELANVYLDYLISIFWMVGITNAVNLLDNMDGIASGVSSVLLFTVAFLLITSHAGLVESAYAVALSGAALGFLIHNFHPALIFMGDAGSLALGMGLGACVTRINLPYTWFDGSSVLFAAIIGALPIFDTTLVCISRIRVGRSIATGGRDHTTHRMVRMGLSERETALVLYGVSAFCGVLAVFSYHWGLKAFMLSLALLVIGGLAALARLLTVPVYATPPVSAKVIELKPTNFEPEMTMNRRVK